MVGSPGADMVGADRRDRSLSSCCPPRRVFLAGLAVLGASAFDLFVNLKTARVLGLTIQQSVLLQATQVIQ